MFGRKSKPKPVRATPEPEPRTRTIVSGGSFEPYYSCAHQGCYKKARPHITSHDCCGTSKHTTRHTYMQREGKEVT